jgi:hypothetical protein
MPHEHGLIRVKQFRGGDLDRHSARLRRRDGDRVYVDWIVDDTNWRSPTRVPESLTISPRSRTRGRPAGRFGA